MDAACGAEGEVDWIVERAGRSSPRCIVASFVNTAVRLLVGPDGGFKFDSLKTNPKKVRGKNMSKLNFKIAVALCVLGMLALAAAVPTGVRA
jgi:hypothetical protein